MSERVALDDLDAEPHANVFPDAEPKTIRLSLDEGESVPEHDHPGRDIVFHLLDGEVRLHLGEETLEATAGDVVRFSGDQAISPTALADSTALIVLARREG